MLLYHTKAKKSILYENIKEKNPDRLRKRDIGADYGARFSVLDATGAFCPFSRGSDMPPACHSTPLPFEPGDLVLLIGADYGARTRHLDLGKVALYQMS